MRRRTLVLLAWITATAIATLAAWQAVAVVASNVTPEVAAPVVPAEDGADEGRAGIGAPTEPAPPSSPPTTAPPTTATTPTTPEPAAPVTVVTAPSASAETRVVDSRGGTIAVRFPDGAVELLWARPEPGFAATIVRRDPDRVEVEFRGDDHTSRIRARWNGGPSVEVDENG